MLSEMHPRRTPAATNGFRNFCIRCAGVARTRVIRLKIEVLIRFELSGLDDATGSAGAWFSIDLRTAALRLADSPKNAAATGTGCTVAAAASEAVNRSATTIHGLMMFWRNPAGTMSFDAMIAIRALIAACMKAKAITSHLNGSSEGVTEKPGRSWGGSAVALAISFVQRSRNALPSKKRPRAPQRKIALLARNCSATVTSVDRRHATTPRTSGVGVALAIIARPISTTIHDAIRTMVRRRPISLYRIVQLGASLAMLEAPRGIVIVTSL